MAVIHILDKHTAELIAAGEVVERPASVVKELLENAIDAGATQITVSIESGGIRLIEVSDNGSGIETEYISTAFIRHATSKIECEADLQSIHTLGFRGEALASIASVARVEVLTKTEVDEFACCYRIEGGEELGMEPGARGTGTTIRVRDLFYNTPARMKFMKKDSSEGTFVADIVGHVALSHPEVSFKFIREGKLQYTTVGDGQLMSAAYAVLGREFARDLMPVQEQIGLYRVTGLITPPKNCRASRSMQYFYINGRYVRNRTMMAGLESAFKGTTMQGKFPGCILMLDMPADLVDVNVHPAKTEVRFARENDVFDVVYHAIKLALAQPGSGERLFRFDTAEKSAADSNAAAFENCEKQNFFTGLSAAVSHQAEPGTLQNGQAAFAFASETLTAEPMHTPVATVPVGTAGAAAFGADEADLDEDIEILPEPAVPYRPAAVTVVPADVPIQSRTGLHSPGSFAAASEKEGILDILPDAAGSYAAEPAVSGILPAEKTPMVSFAAQTPMDTMPVQTMLWEEESEPSLQYVGEVFKTYIIAQRGDELCLIDKHAAHERMLFEQLAAAYGEVDRQILLAPVPVELSAEEKQAALENVELLEDVGLELDDFGGSTVLVRAVPCDVEIADVADLTVELAAKLAAGSRDALNEKTEWVMHSIACRGAVKAGDHTPPEQLLHLAEAILSGAVPPFCPHGRPCVLKLTKKELEKQFGRIV